jgi:hypothetical protein
LITRFGLVSAADANKSEPPLFIRGIANNKRKFLLPKGEGQDEGKEKLPFAFKNLTLSPWPPVYTQGPARRWGSSAVELRVKPAYFSPAAVL